MRILLLSLIFLVSRLEARGPVYKCKNSQEEIVQIGFQGNKANIKRISTKTKEEREWTLTESAAFEDPPKEPIRYLYNLPEKGKRADLKKIFELREQFFREKKPQELHMMLIQEGAILTGWSCVTHGTQIDIKMLEDFSDSIRADTLFLTRAVKGFVTEEQLAEESLGMILQVVERYALWSLQMDKTEFKRLVMSTFQPVLYLSPGMTRQVNERLSENARKTWADILTDLSYASFPPIQRWIFWVGLGTRNNNEAVRAGIRGFVKSPAFKDGNMQKFFEKETKSVFRSLPEVRYKQIMDTGLSEKEKNFGVKLWTQRKV